MGCFYIFGQERGYIDNANCKEDVLNFMFSTKSLAKSDVYVVGNGKILDDDDLIQTDNTYHVIPRMLGGKGGFGSMLRAIGAQIEKTTSREACRDLSGRRMRDVNNEKKLKDWLAKQSDREREKEEKRKERMEQRRRKPQHKFDDPTYHEQKNKVVEDLEDALQRGLEKAKQASATATSESSGSSGISRKRKGPKEDVLGKSKKTKGWLGLDPSLDLSDLDTSEEENDEGMQDSSNNSDSCSSHENKTEETADDNNDTAETEGNSTKAAAQPSTSNTNSSNSSLLSSLPPPHSTSPTADTNTQEKETKDLKPINLDDYSSPEELEDAGLERLKSALMQRGLKCGGTLTQRAERLFSVKGLTKEQIDPSLFAKPAKKK